MKSLVIGSVTALAGLIASLPSALHTYAMVDIATGIGGGV